MTTKIRQAKNPDLQYIIEIIKEHYADFGDTFNLEKFDKDLQDIEQSYFQKNGYFWLAQAESNIVGTIALKPVQEGVAELKRFYVRKKFRRQGIGKQLLNACLDYARGKGLKKIILWTDIRYKQAQSFYLKNGFEPVDKKTFFDADVPWTAIKFAIQISQSSR